jgi:hypothetical protein
MTRPLVDRRDDLGFAVVGVVDRGPFVLADRGDDRGDSRGVRPDRHRVADLQPFEQRQGRLRPEPRVEADHDRAGRPGPADPGDQFGDEASDTPGGVRRAFPHPGVEDLAGIGAGGDQRVVAEDLGVPVRGALLVVSVDLGDGRVDVDDQSAVTGTGARLPRPGEEHPSGSVELADIAEGEGPQERPDGGRGHHVVSEDVAGRAGSEQVDMVDVVPAGGHGVDQGQQLASRTVPAGPVTEVDYLVDDSFDAEPVRHVAVRINPPPATNVGSSKVTSNRSTKRDTRLTGSAS